MIYNDNGVLLERVCINNTYISFPSFYSLNESSNDKENEILQNIEAIKDEIKECDDSKIKKLEKKARTTFIQKKIINIISNTQVCLIGMSVLNVIPAGISADKVANSGFKFKEHKISTAILAIFASMIALIKILNPIRKGIQKSSDKNMDSIKQTLKEVINFFNKTANDNKLPKEIRDDAKKKAIKVSDMLLDISNYDNYNYCGYDTGKTINSNKVFVSDEDNYNLRKNEYDTAINIVNSKWRQIINNILRFIKDGYRDMGNITEKFLSIEDGMCIIYTKEKYEIQFTVYYEYEEYSNSMDVVLSIVKDDFKSKVINIRMDIDGDIKNLVI